MSKPISFTPPWVEQAAPPQSYRSLFKFGDPQGFKHPNSGFYGLFKEVFNLRDTDFSQPQRLRMEDFDAQVDCKLEPRHLEALQAIVGPENVSTRAYDRTRVSYGAGTIDALRLREKKIENLPDAVVAPRSAEDVEAILQYCDRHRIPVYIFGAGSSVTRGTEALKGGITLDMSRTMNQVIAFNETDQTITVQAGMSGPELERILNNAPETLGAKRAYTCGHFPQSFLYSSVGGWVVTRGAGQNSTYYGKIEDMVFSQEYITPAGRVQTPQYPRSAIGPDYNQALIGSEGCFGVLTSVTLKVRRYMPQNTRRFSYLFKSWEDALETYREVMQGEFGFPSVFRLSDQEETDTALRIYHIHGTLADKGLQMLGYQPMQRCLLIGASDGESSQARLVARKIGQIARRNGALPLALFDVTRKWEKTRFTDPYMREDLMDFGILIDTLECAVTWEKLPTVHAAVRKFVKQRPQTICMTHLSHAYPQGSNLYFIFIVRMTDKKEYLAFQYGILQTIHDSGASMSHHHGIGKQTAPWLESQIGPHCMGMLKQLKSYFDPHNIMNPGGTLGLDMSLEQKEKRWSME